MATTAKQPTTLKGWQKLHPDAIKITIAAKGFISNKELRTLVDREGKAKILQNSLVSNWHHKRGTTIKGYIIASKSAYEEPVKTDTDGTGI